MAANSALTIRQAASVSPNNDAANGALTIRQAFSVGPNKNEGKSYKVVVIGNSGVGKTTLTYRFCEGAFLEHVEATIACDFRRKTLEIDGEPITIKLWDTAGEERFRMSMMPQYYRNADAVILVYDVTDRQSFLSLRKWIEECNMNCISDVLQILVGNKCDGNPAVSTNEAQQFADLYNMPLFETSARLDSHCDNVDAIFMTLAHKLKNRKTFLPQTETIRLGKAAVVNDTTQDRSWCSSC